VHAPRNFTRATIVSINTAIELYRIDCGRIPSESQGLLALISDPGVVGWDGPYIRGTASVPSDGWGRPLLYTVVAAGATVHSVGPDGVPLTEDDITTAETGDIPHDFREGRGEPPPGSDSVRPGDGPHGTPQE